MHDKAELEAVFVPVLAQLGLELIRISVSGSPRQPTIMVFADRPGGVNVGECAEATKSLRRALAVHYGPGRAFSLGVSSPGTERPLRSQRDFSFIVGRHVELHVRGGAGDADVHLVGRVLRADDAGVVLEPGESGQEHTVPYERIATARMKLPY